MHCLFCNQIRIQVTENVKQLGLKMKERVLISDRWNTINIIFLTLNKLQHVHLLTMELKNPIFGFEQMDFKYSTTL